MEPVARPVAHTAQQQREFLQANSVAERIERVVSRARSFMEEAQARHEEGANRRRGDAVVWQVGDRVYVNTRNIRQGRPMAKLADKWTGPWPVTRVYKRAVAVELPPQMKIFPVFHVSLVKHAEVGYPGQEAQNQRFDQASQGIVLRDAGEAGDDAEWFFEKIMDSRIHRGQLQYRVKWPHPWRPT